MPRSCVSIAFTWPWSETICSFVAFARDVADVISERREFVIGVLKPAFDAGVHPLDLIVHLCKLRGECLQCDLCGHGGKYSMAHAGDLMARVGLNFKSRRR
jgi:hypothetical protein